MKPINRQTMAEFFGFRDHPFADTYRIKQPYLADHEKRVLNMAASLVSNGKGCSLTGPSGLGKSTLISHLLSDLDKQHYSVIAIHYGGLQRNGLLKAVADRLGVETKGRNIPLLVRIQKRIADMGTGQHAVFPIFVLDDAQYMEKDSLMDICSLTFNPGKETVGASVILVGDESLETLLQLQVMASVATRLTGHFVLTPLSHDQSREFVLARLRQVKDRDDLFDRDALELIAAGCRGNRRKIMNMGTLLLLDAYIRQEKTIGPELIINCEQGTITE